MDIAGKIIKEFFPEKNFPPFTLRVIKWALGLEKLRPYLEIAREKKGIDWIEKIIEVLQLRCETHCGDYENVPEQGPVIVIANHPTAVDGMALIASLSVIRKDIKIVANHVLKVLFPEIEDIAIGIKNMQGKMSHRQLKEMNDHLKKGGLLLIFPAGRLASISLAGLKESS